jgi:protein-S-isoprenylcysteine O-methyltransferase Ste14
MSDTKVRTVRVTVLVAAVAIAVFVFAVTDTVFRSGRLAYELIEWTGLILITICVLGRTWSSLYVAGRQSGSIVSDGPYSVSRNPRDMFSIIGAVGMGMQTGSMAVGVICGVIAWIAFFVIVRQEETFLLGARGKSYRDYLRRVPRFVPRWSLWKERQRLTVPPSSIVWMFRDALIFVLAQPVAEYLQQAHIVPALMKLP